MGRGGDVHGELWAWEAQGTCCWAGLAGRRGGAGLAGRRDVTLRTHVVATWVQRSCTSQ